MATISVIVPIYNDEEYLHRCVHSILSQTYKELEIILIDDGSTDDSGAICDWYKKQDERIMVIHKENGGLSSARNAGLEIARGDYISFIDSDDWIVDDIYEYCINLIKVTNCDVVDFQCKFTKGESIPFDSNQTYITEVIEGKEILRDYLFRGQTDSSPFTIWRKFYKYELFNKVRFPDGKINEDIATNYELLMHCNKLVRTDKIGYYYFQGSTSLTRNGLKKRDFDLLDACENLRQLSQNEGYPDIKYLVRVKFARSYFSLLAKIALYGIVDDDLNQKDIVRDLTKRLRKSFFLLIGSPMPFNRKIMIAALCINIRCLSVPLHIYKKVLGM
ncbi:glycosyltransferase [Anaerospora sp.]|uniref:glycosyltransferase family 2 protein n=1 Tax=Anaerospora sp. TaxID=1960278 RepID=UPI00289BA3ED|nr:glycosyltransferase [Anaerospora sp.]